MTAVLPFTPLAELVGSDSVHELARLLDIKRETVRKYQREGVPLPSADELVVRSGHHPLEVWPVEWYDLLDEPLHSKHATNTTTLSVAQEDELAVLHRAGVPGREAARRLGIPYATAYRNIRRLNGNPIKKRRHRAAPKKGI